MSSTPADYFPLTPGLVLKYDYRDKDGAGSLTFEVLSAVSEAGALKARCRDTVSIGAQNKPAEYDVLRKPDGLYGPWGKEFPLPAAKGLEWIRNEKQGCVLAALDRAVTAPAGTFKECLQVLWEIAEGEGGSGERCYAPGVGLVYAVSRDESDAFEMSLREIRRDAAKVHK